MRDDASACSIKTSITLPVRPPASAACKRRASSASAFVKGTIDPIAPVPGDEHPGQREVFELTQVTEIVVRGQALLAAHARASASGPAQTHTRA